MKAVSISQFGLLDYLKDVEIPIPLPESNEVLIRIKAASINPIDYKIRQGRFGGNLPIVLGHDCAGIVERVGEDVRRFRPGDEVWAYLGGPRSNGSYAEYVSVPQEFVGLKPRRLSFIEAASVPVVALTTYQAIYGKAKPTGENTVFVAGGAGGLGATAIQQLTNLGVTRLVTTAGSDESFNFLVNELGLRPNQILRYKDKALRRLANDAIEANAGRLFCKTFDFVGGEMKKLCFELVAFDGDIVSVVEEEQGFELPVWHGRQSPLFRRSASLHFHLLGARGLYGSQENWSTYYQDLDFVARLYDLGRLRAIGVKHLGELSAETIREAHRLLETGRVQGKLVVSMGV